MGDIGGAIGSLFSNPEAFSSMVSLGPASRPHPVSDTVLTLTLASMAYVRPPAVGSILPWHAGKQHDEQPRVCPGLPGNGTHDGVNGAPHRRRGKHRLFRYYVGGRANVSGAILLPMST